MVLITPIQQCICYFRCEGITSSLLKSHTRFHFICYIHSTIIQLYLLIRPATTPIEIKISKSGFFRILSIPQQTISYCTSFRRVAGFKEFYSTPVSFLVLQVRLEDSSLLCSLFHTSYLSDPLLKKKKERKKRVISNLTFSDRSIMFFSKVMFAKAIPWMSLKM